MPFSAIAGAEGSALYFRETDFKARLKKWLPEIYTSGDLEEHPAIVEVPNGSGDTVLKFSTIATSLFEDVMAVDEDGHPIVDDDGNPTYTSSEIEVRIENGAISGFKVTVIEYFWEVEVFDNLSLLNVETSINGISDVLTVEVLNTGTPVNDTYSLLGGGFQDESNDLRIAHKITEIVFKEVENLARFLPKQIDLQEASADSLSSLAAMVGISLDTRPSLFQQRSYLRAAASLIRSKTTEDDLIDLVTAITRALSVAVKDWTLRRMMYNDVNCPMPDFNNPSVVLNIGRPADTICYMPDFDANGDYNLQTLAVFITPDPTYPLTDAVVRSIYDLRKTFIPAGAKMIAFQVNGDGSVTRLIPT